MPAKKRRVGLFSALTASIVAASLLASTNTALASTATSPPIYGPVVLQGKVHPVSPDGALGAAIPIQQDTENTSEALNCKDAVTASNDQILKPPNTDFQACDCPPSDACWIEYLVGDGFFETTFVATHVATGRVAVLGPTTYFCDGGCVLSQGGGGIGWLADWWTVSSPAGAGVIRQWCQ